MSLAGASTSGESGVGELLVVVVGPVPDLVGVGVVPLAAVGNSSARPVRTSSSSSLILHWRLGRLNFFFAFGFRLQPGQCHLPRGVCKSINEKEAKHRSWKEACVSLSSGCEEKEYTADTNSQKLIIGDARNQVF